MLRLKHLAPKVKFRIATSEVVDKEAIFENLDKNDFVYYETLISGFFQGHELNVRETKRGVLCSIPLDTEVEIVE